MKNVKYIITAFVLLCATTACDDFLDINTSKDKPTTITVDQLLPTLCYYSAHLNYDHAEYGLYLSSALTTGGRSQTNSTAYKGGWEFLSMNRHPQWRRHYFDIGVNANMMIKEAEKVNAKNCILIARTIFLQSLLFTTDAFGDCPRSNAYLATSPTYDKQEDIYEWMYKEADELIALYADKSWTENKENLLITTHMDRIFGGDMGAWATYAKSLKARMLLRKLPNWDNTPAVCNEIITLVDEVLNDPNYKEALFKFDGGSGEQNCPWGPANPAINVWESRKNDLDKSIPTTFFAYGILGAYPKWMSQLQQALDPRASRIMTPRPKTTKALSWLEANIGMAVSDKISEYPDLYGPEVIVNPDNPKTRLVYGGNPFTKNDGILPLMLKEELMFIKAEAQYWAGDKDGAFNTTVEATKHNMVRYGIVYEELIPVLQGLYDNFFAVRLPGAADFTIADLMQQKYVAMYMQPELWTDMRRYNYSSKTNGILYDGVPVYTVKKCYTSGTSLKKLVMDTEYSLARPYNLYEAYWMTPESFGVNAKLSPNAWINRINYDPETEDKYNRGELERLGAYKNPEWLKKRMIWAYNKSGKVTVADGDIEWK